MGSGQVRQLSYTSASQYAECSERWRLSRLHHLDKQTWWVTLMGTAVHETTEQYDLGNIVDVRELHDFYRQVFAREKDRAIRLESEVKASGRELKSGFGKTGGPGRKNEEWCDYWGPRIVDNWVAWRKDSNFQVASFLTSRGETLGVELEVRKRLGGFPFQGFVDRVFTDGNGDYVVVDIKTGSVPQSDAQLKAYAAQLRLAGVDVKRGAFWMGMSGEVDRWVNTPASQDAGIARWLRNTGRGIEAGVFVPNVGAMCSWCPVRDYCQAVGGRHAGDVPVEDGPVKIGPPEETGKQEDGKQGSGVAA